MPTDEIAVPITVVILVISVPIAVVMIEVKIVIPDEIIIQIINEHTRTC